MTDKAKDAGLVVEIDVTRHIVDGLGKPLVIREPIKCGKCGFAEGSGPNGLISEKPTACPNCESEDQITGGNEWAVDKQITFGRQLLDRLNTFRPEKREQSIWVDRIYRKISSCLQRGKVYRAGQMALSILQEAWRQTADMAPSQGGWTPLVDGQVGEVLGITPPKTDLSMVGIDDEEEGDRNEEG